GAAGRAARTPPQPPAPDGWAAARPPPPGPRRPLRRDPGSVSGGRGPTPGVRPQSGDAVLPLAAPVDRPAAPDPPSPAPRRADPQRWPRGRAVPRRASRGELHRAGGSTAGPRHAPERGGGARRAEDPAPGGPQQHGSARPRGPGTAALRAPDDQRG